MIIIILLDSLGRGGAVIRIAEVEDAKLVHEIMLSAFEEYRHLEVPPSALDEKVSLIEESLRNGKGKALLYYQDEIPVGSCRFKIDGDALNFSRLSVRPEFRGNGIAKTILQWLEQYALENNIIELSCRVRMALPQNIDLYQSIGYSVTKEEVVINPNGFPVKTVVMNKKLGC